ncbi:MAG TPA: hypothetical protein VM165_16495 [Planctomycetaceae bacterium]|nr:hypothetical protein [Planctomycetaceae bacterium]
MRRDPFGPASTIDVIRAVFHAIVAGLFTVPMWILVIRFYREWPEFVGQSIWLIGWSSLIVWCVPGAAVLFRWRQQIYRHPERSPSSLVRTYATAQMLGVLLATPLLLWFGVNMLPWFF